MEYKIEQPPYDTHVTNPYRDQLIALGIDANLLPLEGFDYARIHRPLRIARSLFFFPFIEITEKWQIEMLHDPMHVLTNAPQSILSKKDNLGFGIAHYAAWSGDAKSLDWILENQEDLIDAVGIGGKSIGHFAGLSGSTAMLEWVLTKRSHLLPLADDMIQNCIALSGSSDALEFLLKKRVVLSDDNFASRFFDMHTFVFNVARSGSVEALNWILNRRSQFLDAKNLEKRNIADFIAQSGSTDAWNWIVRIREEAMKSHDEATINDIIFSAAISGSAPQLNRALSLLSNPKKVVFDLACSHFWGWDKRELKTLSLIIGNTLNVTLKTNLTLQQIEMTGISIDLETQTSIQRQLDRNKRIKQIQLECITFFQGWVKIYPLDSSLDILNCLLHVMLPQELDIANVKRINNEIKSSLSFPRLRATNLINKEIARLMPFVSINKSVFYFFKPVSDKTIHALTALIALIAEPLASYAKVLDWEREYITISKDKETQDCIDKVKLVLGVEEEQVNAYTHVKALS